MTPAEINTYRRQLQALIRRYSGAVAELRDQTHHGLGGESGGGLSNVPTHLADLGSASYEEEVSLTLLENQEELLEECHAALARIDAGTFGKCEDCGRQIAKGRLQSFPYVRHCVACARKRESQSA